MQKEEIAAKYSNVLMLLEKAEKDLNNEKIKLESEEKTEKTEIEINELNDVISKFEELNNKFKTEIEQLEESSEWDKLCIAFFGETNAGKSTLIESLRIIYDDEKRRETLLKQKQLYCEELADNFTKYDDFVKQLSEMNNAVIKQAKKQHVKSIIKSIGLVFCGAVAGFALSYLYFGVM